MGFGFWFPPNAVLPIGHLGIYKVGACICGGRVIEQSQYGKNVWRLMLDSSDVTDFWL